MCFFRLTQSYFVTYVDAVGLKPIILHDEGLPVLRRKKKVAERDAKDDSSDTAVEFVELVSEKITF